VDDDIETLKILLDRMHDDEIKNIVMRDSLLRKYAILRTETLSDVADQKLNDINRVSASCRTIGRLLVEVKKNHSLVLNGIC
jgi:hypothetical protein